VNLQGSARRPAPVEPIDVDAVLARGRADVRGTLAIPGAPGGGIPVAILTGDGPGPTVWIVASIHGDEYLGPTVLRQFLDDFDRADLQGRLIVTPVLNASGFSRMERADAGGTDMNRVWDAARAPPAMSRLRDFLGSNVLSRCDAVVDLHSGGNRYLQTPFAVFHRTGTAVDARAGMLAKACGTPLVWAHRGSILETSLIAAAARRGTPATLLEIGGEGKAETPDIDEMSRGLLGALRATGVIRGRPSYLESYRVFEGFAVLRNREPGLWRRALEPGADVAEGEPVGQVLDPLGRVLEEISSPSEGVVLGICTYGFVASEDYIAELGLEVRREGPSGRASRAGSRARTAPKDPGP